jgi:hypothetical protein
MNDLPEDAEPIVSPVTVFTGIRRNSASVLCWTEAPENIDAVKRSITAVEMKYTAFCKEGFAT